MAAISYFFRFLKNAIEDSNTGNSTSKATRVATEAMIHHVHIREMNGDSFRLKNSRKKKDAGPQRAFFHPRLLRGGFRSALSVPP